MAEQINFFNEDITFRLRHKRVIRSWIEEVVRIEGKVPGNINFIFCSDRFLLKMNKRYLGKSTLTDVIAFNTEEDSGIVEGDIFISRERVLENSRQYKQKFLKELSRVMVHGVLHLAGWEDDTERKKNIMHEREDLYLNRLPGLIVR